MNIQLNESCIPGTVLDRKKMGDVTGLRFLKKIFYISDGIMLSGIREISGIDGSTLQNWTKRGWVGNSKQKRYNIDQVAHILIINMLRSCMQLENIAFLIKYINGRVDDVFDDIIRDSVLYDYICRIIDVIAVDGSIENDLSSAIVSVTAEYEEKIGGARKRLNTALEIIITAYYAALIKQRADSKLADIMK